MPGAVTIFKSTEEAEAIWRTAQQSTRCYVFQSFEWCHTWMETAGSRQGVTAHRPYLLDGGNVELLLPLQLQKSELAWSRWAFSEGGRPTMLRR